MIRDIQIHAVLNGFTVQIGCQTIVFTTVENLASNLVLYLNNPDEFEQEFLHTSINVKHTMPPRGCVVPPAEQAIAGLPPQEWRIRHLTTDGNTDPWDGIEMPSATR